MLMTALVFLLCGYAAASNSWEETLDEMLDTSGFALEANPTDEYTDYNREALSLMGKYMAGKVAGTEIDIAEGNYGSIIQSEATSFVNNYFEGNAQFLTARYRREMAEEIAKKGLGRTVGGKLIGRLGPNVGLTGLPLTLVTELNKIVIEVGVDLGGMVREGCMAELRDIASGGVDGSDCYNHAGWITPSKSGCAGFVPYEGGGWGPGVHGCAEKITTIVMSSDFCVLLKKAAQLRSCKFHLSHGKWGPCCQELYGHSAYHKICPSCQYTPGSCLTPAFRCCQDRSAYMEDADDGQEDGRICPSLPDLTTDEIFCSANPPHSHHAHRSTACNSGWGKNHWGCALQWLQEYHAEIEVLADQASNGYGG